MASPARPRSGAGTAPPTSTSGEASALIAARIDRVPTGRFHIRLASIVGGGTFFDGFDAISLAVVLPLVVATFGIDFSQAGLIVSAGHLGQFLGALVIGALSDRIGRRLAFISCLAVFGALAIGCALATSADSLLVFRLLQGIGLGAEVPIAATLVNEYLGRRNRGRFSVVYQSLFTWGLFFAPLIALLLIPRMEPEAVWRTLLGLGALPLVVAVVAWFTLPESARWLADKGRLDEAEHHVARLEQSATSAGRTLPEPEVVAAATVHRPARLRELFEAPYGSRTLVLGIIWFSTFFVTYGFTVWLPSLYVSIGGLVPTRSLLLTVILGAVQVAMCYVVASLVERLGRRRVFMTGFAIAGVGALFGFVNIDLLDNSSWPVLFATGVIMTIGIILPTVSLYMYTSELYPTRMRGFASSSASSLARVASILSPSIFGYLLNGHGGAGAIFAILAGFCVVGLVTMAVGGIETRNRALEEISA
ncbi:MFS transporter [Klenkia terrae]|uniref:MFS transporter n=1 Tax=Klenkia terrae TaxID=1052259 RepID=A0ABU8E699_9ACTN